MKEIRTKVLFLVLCVIIVIIAKELYFQDNNQNNDTKNLAFTEEELKLQQELNNYVAKIEAINNELRSIYKFQYDKNKSKIQLIREQMPDFISAIQNSDTSNIEKQIVDISTEIKDLMALHNVYHDTNPSKSQIDISANVDNTLVKCSYLLELLEIKKSEGEHGYFIERSSFNSTQGNNISRKGNEATIARFMYRLYCLE